MVKFLYPHGNPPPKSNFVIHPTLASLIEIRRQHFSYPVDRQNAKGQKQRPRRM